jgi:hypothetical protein
MARKLTLRNAAVEDADRVASVLDDCTRYYLNRPTSAADALYLRPNRLRT